MWTVELSNIAGIRSGQTTLESGPNVVQASNWQGKSSFVAGIETAMGTRTALTDGADRGSVTIEAPDWRVSTDLRRDGPRVVREGDPYLTDERDQLCAELFAFLSEDNPVRTAVRRGENLEETLTRPLDLENIDEQIQRLKRDRSAVDDDLEAAQRAKERLPDLEEQVTQLEADLADLRERRADLEESAGAADDDEAIRETLSDRRADRNQLQTRIEQLEERIESTNTEIEEAELELENVTVPEIGDVDEEIGEKEGRIDELQRQIDALTDLYNANRRLLESGYADLVTDVDRGLSGDRVTCWVCGSESGREEIEGRLGEIDDQITDLRSLKSDLETEISDLKDERRQRERAVRTRERLESSLADSRARRDDYRSELQSSRERLAELDEEVESLEAELASLEADADDAGAELTEVESEIKYTEARLEDARESLSEAEAEAERVETLSERRAALTEDIETLRTRRERVEQAARDAFDEAMAEVLDAFEPGFEHARLTSTFDLVVARDGREVGLDALSEGEVELLGIVAALAGYEAFDVADAVPVVLLDELGGLASEHLHTLVDYVAARAPVVVTTAYPEAGGFEANVVSPGEWTVVSDDVQAV
jgi:predicted  nucleic acid-binding Zn-ribbon protein